MRKKLLPSWNRWPRIRNFQPKSWNRWLELSEATLWCVNTICRTPFWFWDYSKNWMFGFLWLSFHLLCVSHRWSFSPEDNRSDVSLSCITQPLTVILFWLKETTTSSFSTAEKWNNQKLVSGSWSFVLISILCIRLLWLLTISVLLLYWELWKEWTKKSITIFILTKKNHWMLNHPNLTSSITVSLMTIMTQRNQQKTKRRRWSENTISGLSKMMSNQVCFQKSWRICWAVGKKPRKEWNKLILLWIC